MTFSQSPAWGKLEEKAMCSNSRIPKLWGALPEEIRLREEMAERQEDTQR